MLKNPNRGCGFFQRKCPVEGGVSSCRFQNASERASFLALPLAFILQSALARRWARSWW